MKILFYGAGVIGSVLAAKLGRSGHDITMCARNKRLAYLKENGIIIKNGITGAEVHVQVRTIEKLGPEEYYDLAVVPVRADHLGNILPALAANRKIPLILIMVNNPKGYSEYNRMLGQGRYILGFPGFGGGFNGPVVEYALAHRLIQPTTFGEPDGRITGRIKKIAAVFKKAGFPVSLSNNMDAWQKTHIAGIMPLAGAIYCAGGSARSLADRPDLIRRMVYSIREGLEALESIGCPVTPGKMKLFRTVPAGLLVRILAGQCRSVQMELLATRHCASAAIEMRQLADGLLELLKRSGRPCPETNYLMDYVPGS